MTIRKGAPAAPAPPAAPTERPPLLPKLCIEFAMCVGGVSGALARIEVFRCGGTGACWDPICKERKTMSFICFLLELPLCLSYVAFRIEHHLAISGFSRFSCWVKSCATNRMSWVHHMPAQRTQLKDKQLCTTVVHTTDKTNVRWTLFWSRIVGKSIRAAKRKSETQVRTGEQRERPPRSP